MVNTTYLLNLRNQKLTKGNLKVFIDVPDIEPSEISPCHRAILKLSIDAMLGLGTELIREALRIKEAEIAGDKAFCCHELWPMYKDAATLELGVYTSFDSSTVVI